MYAIYLKKMLNVDTILYSKVSLIQTQANPKNVVIRTGVKIVAYSHSYINTHTLSFLKDKAFYQHNIRTSVKKNKYFK